MKAFILVSLISSLSFADSWRSIQTDNLTCTGKHQGKKISLSVEATESTTKLSIKIGNQQREILNQAALQVMSEGNVYIQQVSNELNYNLSLYGDDLWDVLKGETKQVSLSGNIYLDGTQYPFSSCQGTLR